MTTQRHRGTPSIERIPTVTSQRRFPHNLTVRVPVIGVDLRSVSAQPHLRQAKPGPNQVSDPNADTVGGDGPVPARGRDHAGAQRREAPGPKPRHRGPGLPLGTADRPALGPSTDRTDEVASVPYTEDPRVRPVPNPTGKTPAGLNAALAATDAPIVVRVDGHALLPPDYVRAAVAVL